MSKLFEPLQLRDVTLRNRIAVSPMCQYSSEDGFANDWHLVHLGARAIGGAGLIITEAAAISPEGRISPWDLGVWKDEHITMLRRITDFIHSNGATAGIQLAHAGRKASVDTPWRGGKFLTASENGWQPLAPSPLPLRETDAVPIELDAEGIRQVVDDFRSAALRALKAGFRLIEIHAAHGYLLNEFMSPVSNFRKDEYGGTFENRIRLLLQVISAVRGVWPERLPLFIRISASDWTPQGWTVDDSVKLATIVKEHGVDLIDCSSGGNVYRAKIETGPMYQVPFAERVRNEGGIMTGAVGLITTAQECEEISQNEKADIILLARQMLRDPNFPLHAAKELGVKVDWPVQYERARN